MPMAAEESCVIEIWPALGLYRVLLLQLIDDLFAGSNFSPLLSTYSVGDTPRVSWQWDDEKHSSDETARQRICIYWPVYQGTPPLSYLPIVTMHACRPGHTPIKASRPGFNQISSLNNITHLLSNSIHSLLRIRPRQIRHHTRIDNTQPPDPIHLQPLINNPSQRPRHHSRRPDGVKRRRANHPPHSLAQRLVTRNIRPRNRLHGRVARQRRGLEKVPPREADELDLHGEVGGIAQRAVVYDGLREEGVAGVEGDCAARERVEEDEVAFCGAAAEEEVVEGGAGGAEGCCEAGLLGCVACYYGWVCVGGQVG
ncbi:glucose oxidase [Colletotrichum scovillei]|uniref:Glucose oxidase n=1 Tax=Colletotrichum scovillei TaxID=1209932 RepID=A0A9P7UAS3_9PEZI|nr:glucose oxidase [Colletotrichum scovillei]KAG7059861.1 glucose oxidase [Colletotrichum scovillei]KAG7067311.1 glucose oxidase [Colletotrichum scovillei]